MSGIDLSVVSVTDLVVATSIQDLYLVDSGYLKKRCQQKETQTPGSRFFCLFVCLFFLFCFFGWSFIPKSQNQLESVFTKRKVVSCLVMDSKFEKKKKSRKKTHIVNVPTCIPSLSLLFLPISFIAFHCQL